MDSPIPGFELLAPSTIEKWHSQEDIDDPPFKRPLRAMQAHHEAVERVAELIPLIQNAKTRVQFCFYELLVALTMIVVGSIGARYVSLYTVVIAVAGVVAAPFFARGLQLAVLGTSKLVAEDTAAKKAIETNLALSKSLIAEADKKIIDLGPPPPEPEKT